MELEELYPSKSMWSERLSGVLYRHAGPVIFTDDSSWGASHIIAASSAPERPLVWLELAPRDADDHVVQGNKLAEAVKQALGSSLFGYGLPFGYGVTVLKAHLELLGPFTFALSGAEHGAELARALTNLGQGGNRVILHFYALPGGFSLPKKAFVLQLNTLRLTREEALSLARGQLPEENVLKVWEASGGAYETFLAALHIELSLPPPLRPGPEETRSIGHEFEVEPALLDALLKRERWLEALELAAQRFPERVPEVLRRAGEKLWTQSYHSRLYPLLANLPGQLRKDETVLRWYLLAAMTLGKEREVLPEVEALLETNEAPDLRAIYAEACFSLGNSEGSLRASERAAVQETTITLYVRGRLLGLSDPEAGLALLEKSLRLAEARGERYFAAQIAGAVAARASTLGRYRVAVQWAGWGLKLYRQEGIAQETVRLSLLNERAYASILLGETAGLEKMLRQEVAFLADVHPPTARLLRSTLADLLLSQGQSEEALGLYRALWEENQKRQSLGALANLYVRALLEVGEIDEALKVGEHAVELGKDVEPVYRRRGLLALGMVLSEVAPEHALTVLQQALQLMREPFSAPELAQAGFYLAKTQLTLKQVQAARDTLEATRPLAHDVADAGLRYLAGPPAAFHEVFNLLKGEEAPLELRFLGHPEVRFRGTPQATRKRFTELLTVLALHPEGLSGEQLALAVYGEEADSRACKVELGRLRKHVPLKRRPYRLGVKVWTDFLEVEALLEKGQLMKALALYRGPLLPASDAPEVVTARENLEETLRQAILTSGNAEGLWLLANKLSDDLTLWETAVDSLSLEDPRRTVAQVRVSSLKKRW